MPVVDFRSATRSRPGIPPFNRGTRPLSQFITEVVRYSTLLTRLEGPGEYNGSYSGRGLENIDDMLCERISITTNRDANSCEAKVHHAVPDENTI